MYAANIKTELVDWKTLNGQSARGKSDELMRHVATLFSLTADHCTDEQIHTYDIVLQRLADLVGVETRSFAAQKIGHLENAPYSIIRRFAFDTIRVASPVLQKSPLLSDQDLIEISQEKGEQHMVAISTRDALSILVTDALIHSNIASVLLKLAANDNADLSEEGLLILREAAHTNHMLRESLEKRLSPDDDVQGADQASAGDERNLNVSELWQMVEHKIAKRHFDLSDHPYLARYNFNPSLQKVSNLHRQGLLDKAILRQYANNDQFADVVCGLAQICGIPHQIMARLMSSSHWAQIFSLFKILGFSDRLVQDLLNCGPWKLCLSRNQCTAIVKQYREMGVEEARHKVLSWPQDGLILD